MGKGCGDGLPEDCVAIALSLTSPKDVCRLSAVNSTFRSASQSETVWSRFLPSDIISRAVHSLPNFPSNKDLYFYLCHNPILIDRGRKSFSLEKSSGKKCYMLSASELVVVELDDDYESLRTFFPRLRSRYCRTIFHQESRFHEAVELRQERWFDIRGNINSRSLSPGTNYAAYLVFTCKSRLYGLATVAIDGHHEGKKLIVYLGQKGAQLQINQIVGRLQRLANTRRPLREHGLNLPDLANMGRPLLRNIEYPKQRSDGWMEVELGEYFVKEEDDGGDLKLRLSEIREMSGPKGGTIIQGIEIRPKNADS